MVLSLPLPRPAERPQPIRFTALGLALAVNLLALLFLSLPREVAFAPPAPPKAEPEPTVWIKDPPPAEVLPVPPPPVPPMRRERTRQIDTPAPPAPPLVELPADHAYTIDPAPTGGGADIIGVEIAPPPSQVALLVAPQPPYPAVFVRKRIEGTVTLLIRVGVDGRPLQVEVDESSGHRALDRHAREHVLERWRFEPALRDGRPVEAWARIPIDFTIPR